MRGRRRFVIHRPSAAEHHHRHAVDVGVEDRHAGMLQTDHVVHDGDHRFVFRLGVAMGDGDRDFFVMAEDHFGLVIAAIVDDGIVNAAESRAGIERGVFDVDGLSSNRRPRPSRIPVVSFLLWTLF